MRVEACGATLDEARTKLNEKLKEDKFGLHALGLAPAPELLHQRVVFDGTKVITEHRATIEEALKALELLRAINNIPAEATTLEQTTTPPGEKRTESVEAFNEDDARNQIRAQHGANIIITAVSKEVSGSRGFLGLGKKTPNQYAVTMHTPAVASVTYKFARVLGFARSDRESPACQICMTLIVESDAKKALDGIEDTYVPSLCDGCYEWICYWCATHLLAPSMVPTDHAATIRRKLAKVGEGKVMHLECNGFLRSFRSLAHEWTSAGAS